MRVKNQKVRKRRFDGRSINGTCSLPWFPVLPQKLFASAQIELRIAILLVQPQA